ncbi:MAG: ATP-binding protein [Ignavibacteria bacterium]|nr:ATP-binding protein [Ignavibacteria bacterium]
MKRENKITVLSSTKNLHSIRKFIERSALNSGIKKEKVDQIVLAVDEACTNIIKYTYNYEESHRISIKTLTNNKEFIVEIIYRGKGFDPNKVKSPNMKEYLKKFKVGGLGIPLMKKFLNKIEYHHIRPNLNKLILIKQL